MRVHELAKELNVSAKDLIPLLVSEGLSVKSHMSAIDDDAAQLFKQHFLESNAPEHDALPSPTSNDVISEDIDDDEALEMYVDEKAIKYRKKRKKEKKQDPLPPLDSSDTTDVTVKEIFVAHEIQVKELSDLVAQPVSKIISTLMNLGLMVTQNQFIDYETAAILAHELGIEIHHKEPEQTTVIEKIIPEEDDPTGTLVEKAPVVTFMGHVDHGKTSLIDYIRKTKVAAGEAGSITQHIGAYEITFNKKRIVIIDTPGHKAFTAMRSRGANVTDIAILVVAADDGIMEQTREAINHARAAKVPIIVALNKIDKPNADPEKVFRQLSEINLMTEDWGGDTICCKVSAITGEGVDHLIEMILIQSEMMELKASPDAPCKGIVIESKMTRGRGPTVSVLITAGTLKIGDPIICDSFHGKVKAMLNDRGQNIAHAGPATPVEVLGLDGVPDAGAILKIMPTEKEAKRIAQERQSEERRRLLESANKPTTLEELYKKIESEETHELKLIIKGDVHGSVEALRQSLEDLSTEKVSVSVIHMGVGDINESDVTLASASGAVIIGFCTKIDKRARDISKKENVQIKTFAIIYEAIDNVRMAMQGMLGDKVLESYSGAAEVRETFSISKIGVIAGCYVNEGKASKKSKIRVIRENEVLFEGKIASLKRFKDEVKEVKAGMECGIKIENFNDIEIGDIFEFYTIERVAQTL